MVTKKLPVSPLTGFKIDHLNPANWMTYEQAVATGKPIGFVLSKNDPFFFLDLDKCMTEQGWSQGANEIYQRFAGAACEVSQSGTGLHVVGTCDQVLTANLRNKWDGWLEFYTHERFIAFGPYGWQGDFSKDCTAAILATVPVRATKDETEWSDEPVPEYTGPEDDEELIAKAMRQTSVGAIFGQRASFKHLWEGDASVLCQVFPSPTNDVFDRSSADAALMAHLAFWTGKNAARMDRLFRRSALMRDKYEKRTKYRVDTIQNSIGVCRKVYDIPKPAPRTETTSNDAPLPSGEIMDITTQIKYFTGCVYVLDAHRVLTPSGEFLRPEQFKTFYGGYEFLMSGDGSKPTRNAYEAFTENRAHSFPKVKTTMFRPLEMPGRIIDEKVNVYFPQHIVKKAGDPAPFLGLVAKLLPNERDRTILISYMAAAVQNIGIKFQWAPVLQGTQGNGKTFIAKCLEYAIGPKYTHSPAAEDLANPFNSYLENKLLITVEEIHMQGRREILDTLKPLITNERVEIQPKGIDKRMVDNMANWFFCTNHKDAILKTKDDRRYSMFFTAQQFYEHLIRDGMDGEYFPNLWNWAKYQDGFAIVAEYLHTFAVPAEFNPAAGCHRAPETSTTGQAIKASMGSFEQEILERIDQELPGFRGGWISGEKLDELVKEMRLRISPQRRNAILEELGYTLGTRASRIIMEEGSKRPPLYIKRELWHDMLHQDDYMTAQGYQSIIYRMPGM